MSSYSGPQRSGRPLDAVRRHLRVGKADMRDFYAILESYEGITTARTIDVEQSIVQMDVAPQMVEVFERILEALAEQIDLSEVPEPAPGDRSSREP